MPGIRKRRNTGSVDLRAVFLNEYRSRDRIFREQWVGDAYMEETDDDTLINQAHEMTDRLGYRSLVESLERREPVTLSGSEIVAVLGPAYRRNVDLAASYVLGPDNRLRPV